MRRSSALAIPLLRPRDVVPHLGRPMHWKQGRSAKSLADTWFHARGLPASIRTLLDQSDVLSGAELLEGWLERETDLGDGRGKPSQTDLLAVLGIGDTLAVLGIEAKVDESFGKLISEWLEDGGDGKARRLAHLCKMFALEPDSVGALRYQLLHRTASVLIEAKRFRSSKAVIIIESFCTRSSGLADCRAFFAAIGLTGFESGRLIGPVDFGGVQLWAGWAADAVPREE